MCPLFWWLNPPKQGFFFFQSKQGSFGFQVAIISWRINSGITWNLKYPYPQKLKVGIVVSSFHSPGFPPIGDFIVMLIPWLKEKSQEPNPQLDVNQ